MLKKKRKPLATMELLLKAIVLSCTQEAHLQPELVLLDILGLAAANQCAANASTNCQSSSAHNS